MDQVYRLLAVDDQLDILRTNRKYLESKGYEVHIARCAEEALEKLRNNSYDCILLDVLLPDIDGFSLCKAVRELTSAPILFLSCMDDEEDKVKGLLAGGDDYITKPYSLKELAARVYAQVRRSLMKKFAIDYEQQLLTVDGRVISLPQKEFELFLYLLKNPRRVFTTRQLYTEVWKNGKEDTTNTVAVHIARLRRRLEGTEKIVGRIETVRGEGYQFLPGTEVRIKL